MIGMAAADRDVRVRNWRRERLMIVLHPLERLAWLERWLEPYVHIDQAVRYINEITWP
jgi:hypothetical protein